MRMRFVSLRLPSGELEVLATSLLEEERYPTEELLTVYHWRWGHETFYLDAHAFCELALAERGIGSVGHLAPGGRTVSHGGAFDRVSLALGTRDLLSDAQGPAGTGEFQRAHGGGGAAGCSGGGAAGQFGECAQRARSGRPERAQHDRHPAPPSQPLQFLSRFEGPGAGFVPHSFQTRNFL